MYGNKRALISLPKADKISLIKKHAKQGWAKSDLKQSIGNKGVTIPDEAPIDTYNHYVDLIETGSGGSYNGNVEGSGDITVSFQYINQQGDTAYHHIKCNKGDTVTFTIIRNSNQMQVQLILT